VKTSQRAGLSCFSWAKFLQWNFNSTFFFECHGHSINVSVDWSISIAYLSWTYRVLLIPTSKDLRVRETYWWVLQSATVDVMAAGL